MKISTSYSQTPKLIPNMTRADLVYQLEAFLLLQGTWVPMSEICQRFGVEERSLRATATRRAVFANFAISSSTPGQNGLKHMSFTTVAERLAYKHNRRRRLVAEVRALRDYETALHNCLTGQRAAQIERHTGQSLLPL